MDESWNWLWTVDENDGAFLKKVYLRHPVSNRFSTQGYIQINNHINML